MTSAGAQKPRVLIGMWTVNRLRRFQLGMRTALETGLRDSACFILAKDLSIFLHPQILCEAEFKGDRLI